MGNTIQVVCGRLDKLAVLKIDNIFSLNERIFIVWYFVCLTNKVPANSSCSIQFLTLVQKCINRLCSVELCCFRLLQFTLALCVQPNRIGPNGLVWPNLFGLLISASAVASSLTMATGLDRDCAPLALLLCCCGKMGMKNGAGFI